MDASRLPDWIVLVPPTLVLVSVLTTRRIISSFILGIVSSALVVTKVNFFQATELTLTRLWGNTGLASLQSFESFFGSWNLLIFIFLICLGIIIVLLAESGAAQTYVQLISKRVSTKKEAESASLILSLFFFIDDYFSVLTVGSVMRPLALRHNVHPVKLAFLATAMATPLTIISPVSSWLGEILLQLKQVGIGPAGPKTIIATDPFTVYVSAIPYLLYPLLVIICTWYIVLRGISYGPMKEYDNQELYHEEDTLVVASKASLIDFLLPNVVLVGTVFGTMLYTGGYSYQDGIINALKNASIPQSLFAGGLASLVVCLVYFVWKGILPRKKILPSIKTGFVLMFPSILMLICAWAFGALLKNDLKTGSYIATLVATLLNVEFFPVICFLFAAVISCVVGSAWATIGLMFPIVIDMLQKLLNISANTPLASVELAIPLVGATLSGAVMGVHISIISDNQIMSAASTGANHLEHVKTMAWYVLPIGFASAVGFTVIGLTADPLGLSMALASGALASLVTALLSLELCNYLFGKKRR